jgi:tyrosinase
MGSLTTNNNTANTGLANARQIPPPAPLITGPFELSINNSSSGAAYVGWTLSACSLRITDQPQADRNVVLRNNTALGGQVIFRSTYTSVDQNILLLTLPGDGSPVNFFVGGRFGSPSTEDQDARISVVDNETPTNTVLHQRTLMVRVRKNANNLTVKERDLLLDAYAKVNASGYQVFLDSHNAAASREIHARPSFLPWHRAFLLSFERHLQVVHPSVTVPYWHFDQPSPNIFSPDFMGGTPDSVGTVALSSTNPLTSWKVLGIPGIVRAPLFNTATSGAQSLEPALTPVRNETSVLALGPGFIDFNDMEFDPHNSAHSSFSTGPLISPPTATRDPLFFLLHCNIDRLWAKWQLARNLYNTSNINTYSPQPIPAIGDFLTDTMWPWNGVTTPPRPSTAPGGPLLQLAFPSKPGPVPTVADVIDYIGKTQGNSNYFDYDDVPFI